MASEENPPLGLTNYKIHTLLDSFLYFLFLFFEFYCYSFLYVLLFLYTMYTLQVLYCTYMISLTMPDEVQQAVKVTVA